MIWPCLAGGGHGLATFEFDMKLSQPNIDVYNEVKYDKKACNVNC